MTKRAADEAALGTLHATVAAVFQKVLEGYHTRAEIAASLTKEEMQEMAEKGLDPELLLKEPNPAMLAAVTKFLKDNEITADADEVDGVRTMTDRLAEKRARRRNVVDLHSVPLTGTDD